MFLVLKAQEICIFIIYLYSIDRILCIEKYILLELTFEGYKF